ncbi:MAG: acyl-CoA dehydrogenase family protein [Pirellulales bacterium]|nr:acyl-CoA dehydrogenase family protein [Pirellulales bacterium]
MSNYFQDPPRLTNQFLADRLLRDYLSRHLPEDVHAEVEPDLTRLGERVVGDIAAWGADAEAQEPRLESFDPWGRRIDRIDTARGWRELDRISAEEGMVAIGYERRQGPLSRLYQFAKLYLFNPSSAIYTCPLAMTDGAARLIEVHGDEFLRAGAYQRLTSRDPEQFWTAGQWMTERAGGSDVGQSETVARRVGDAYRLYGDKWFTSATTSQMAFTLARIEDDAGRSTPGSRGLSLFYLETRDAAGRLNAIEIHRLKDKLGTRALPTAELSLRGTPARLVGQANRGVPQITALVNVTRIYNTVCAVSGMRRAVALARDFAARREAFGRPLAEQPLHAETLADLELEFQAGFHLGFHVVRLLGLDECGAATPEESAELRLLTPLAKLYTGKQAAAVASETLEAFGGAGYIENTGIPKLLRDAQVLSIWEGTTNVLSLDALRAIEKDEALPPVLDAIQRRQCDVRLAECAPLADAIDAATAQIRAWLPEALNDSVASLQTGARGFAFALARTYIASLLLDHAQWELETLGSRRGLVVARRWCAKNLAPLVHADASHRAESQALATDGDLAAQPQPVH